MAAVEVRGLPDALAALDPVSFEKAHRRTVNDMARQSRTASSKVMRQTYTVKARELTKRMRVRLLSGASDTARITVTGAALSVYAFTGTRATRSGISVKIKRAGQRKVIRHGFAVSAGAGKVAFRRRWRRLHTTAPTGTRTRGFARMPRRYRLPIEKLTSVGPATMFDQQPVYQAVQALVDAKAGPTFQRHFRYYSSR